MFAKKAVVFSVFILVWFALAEVIGLSCARMGVQAAIGMWADWLYVAIQLCIVSLGIFTAYLVRRRIQAWDMAKTVTAACVVGLVALVIISHTNLWVMFGKSDSDERIVPSWEFNIQTPEARVPRNATDIHVRAWRGISPSTLVTFRVESSEARAYLERVMVARHITQDDLKNPELQERPSEMFPDSWGKARDDQPWWYRRDGGIDIFIQVDISAGRVYLMHQMP